MDRRLPPSFRSTATTDDSPGRERPSSSVLNRSHNRPWATNGGSGGAGGVLDSPSRAKYSSLRSNSPSLSLGGGSNHSSGNSSARGTVPPPLHGNNPYSTGNSSSGGRRSSPTTIDGSLGRNRHLGASSPLHAHAHHSSSSTRTTLPSAAVAAAAGAASSAYNGMDTTTTIDGSRGSVSAGLSSYERYRSLRLQSASSPNTTGHISTGSSLFSSSPPSSASPSSSAFSSTSAFTSTARSGSPLLTTTTPSPSSSTSAATTTTRPSSPRDLRKQRLQQQYNAAASGRTSPFRATGSEPSSTIPSGRASPFRHHNTTLASSSSDPMPPPTPTHSYHAQPPLASTTAASSSGEQSSIADTSGSGAVGSSSREKKSRKSSSGSKKSSSRHSSTGSDGDGDSKKSSRHRSRRSSSGDASDDEGSGTSSHKKKKKSSKHGRSSKSSSSKNRNKKSPSSSGDDDYSEGYDNGVVEEQASPNVGPPKNATTTTSATQPSWTAADRMNPSATSVRAVRPHLAPSAPVGLSVDTATSSRLADLQRKSSLEANQRITSSGSGLGNLASPPVPAESKRMTSSISGGTSIISPISAAIRNRVLSPGGTTLTNPAGYGRTSSSGGGMPPIQSTSSTPSLPDEKPSTTNAAVRGWSTYRNRSKTAGEGDVNSSNSNDNTNSNSIGARNDNPFVSQSNAELSKVSQYLNMRKNTATSTGKPLASTTIDKDPTAWKPRHDADTTVTASSHSTSTTLTTNNPQQQNNLFAGSTSEGTTDDDIEDDEEEEESSTSSSEEDEQDAMEWSVRVCVVSAIDLPSNVVPTVPFSPVLKVGLVKLTSRKQQQQAKSSEEPTQMDTKAQGKPDEIPPELKKRIHEAGLLSVPKARIRSTGPKVMSKRDNGAVEFHEEMRWDATQQPEQMALAIELSARAVMTPSNHKESPYEQVVKALDFPATASRQSSKDSAVSAAADSNDKSGRLKNLFRRGNTGHPSSEMDVAKAAAAVAKHLVEGEESGGGGGKSGDEEESAPGMDTRAARARNTSNTALASNNPSTSELNVKLLSKYRARKPRLTDDIRLGSQIIPISKLSWKKAMNNNEAARIEQWFELETAAGGSPSKPGAKSSRNPSVLLEISFSSPDVLDESEDEIEEEEGDDVMLRDSKRAASFSRRASKSIRAQLLKEVQLGEVKRKEEEPVLEPGVIDHVCVVGPLNIGDQKADDGASGWVNTNPDCGVLEQFPAVGYHANNGRNVSLPDKVEWFCFPEGCRLWRGTTPPNAEELHLVRFSASSPANIATTIASFDACLGCTTSFSWFVLSSNSDEYGSANTKTYGACIRFFVPAPTGIDPTQDDFGQSIRGAALYDKASKRLWVPIALCMTAHIPIVGAMEVMLLRICESLSSMMGQQGNIENLDTFFEDVANLVTNYQRPIPGIVSCSIPFLSGDRLNLSLPPATGLPSLPHGASVTSACRLLQANGINYMLAAMLTECKILIHSNDVSNLCLVAEVMTALMYPFQWSLPYIPVLPVPMMEFIEAPLSYLLGIPSSTMRLINPECLEDVVVIDLDNDFSGVSGHVDEIRDSNTKTPTPLPASTALNIQKAVYRLLQRSGNNDDDENGGTFPPSRTFPRLEPETNVEREFRISISLEIASLVRGYQDCLVTGPSSQPMFNVDKFLQSAPILFDEQRGTSLTSSSGLRVLSPRSRRFISILVTCQHFHQFLDAAESDSLSFFREVMTELEAYGSKRDLLAVKRVLSLDAQKTIDQLNSILMRVEDKIPLYKVKKVTSEKPLSVESAKSAALDFPYSLLCPIIMEDTNQQNQSDRAEGVNQISLEYLVELEKNPWRYQRFLSIELDQSKEGSFIPVGEKVKLRDAIGERKYHLWKNSLERMDEEEGSTLSDEPSKNQTLDLTALLVENGEEGVATENQPTGDPNDAAKRRIADAKDRDSLRRCLEQARVAGGSGLEATTDPSRDLVSEAESALCNESARKFLLAILQKRGSNDSADSFRSRRKLSSGVSKLESSAFEVLLRLGCAMLDACIEDRDYDSAYSLLKLTAGLYSTVGDDESLTVLYMTQRLGHHPIYADLGVWLRAKKMHLNAAAAEEKGEDEDEPDDAETDEYEAAVATLYEMLGYDIPAEELARFASRVSEENGWFRSERGQSLLLLARRICMRRDTGSANSSQRTTSDIEMMSPTSTNRDRGSESTIGDDGSPPTKGFTTPHPEISESWTEIGWVHPSAQYSSRFEKDVKRKPPRNDIRNRHMKRSAITSMAYLGSSVVVTGGLDGGVFLARNVTTAPGSEEENGVGVKGIHLDWGSAGSRFSAQSPSTAADGSYGVGAVSILAATQPANQSYDALQMKPGPSRKSVTDQLDEEELLNAMDGCRVVAGTTCGDLRVWSVKDVLSAVFYALRGNEIGNSPADERSIHRGGEGVSSSVIGNRRRTGVDFAAGSSLTRLKFSLRGRALSGHRGGVSCVDVPSHVYRPDSIISGGADGLIKLWSLRSPGSIGRRSENDTGRAGAINPLDDLSPRSKSTRSGDAMSILAGHGGRVLCVKTAWHGDRLLSGGADRTVRLWDLGGSGGKCLNSLSGHFGWVTSVKYWGPNTIISASTDRSIALWDARVRNAPLFVLRHHYAPISDILVGARTDPIMISAGGDGTIAAWDFRRLSDPSSQSPSSKDRQCKVIRRPAGKLYLHDFSSRRRTYGPVLLSRGPTSRTKTVRCLGRDAIIREWDIRSGDVISEHVTGHCDTVSTFASLDGDKVFDSQVENSGKNTGDGTITTSWDGTVRVRRFNKV